MLENQNIANYQESDKTFPYPLQENLNEKNEGGIIHSLFYLMKTLKKLKIEDFESL